MVHSVKGFAMQTDGTDTAINVTAFKERCLALIDAVAQGKTARVVLTRHGRPVAAQVPYDQTIVTRDGELTLYAQVGHIVAIEC